MLRLDESMRLTAWASGTVSCHSVTAPMQTAAISQAASSSDCDWDMAFRPTWVGKRIAWHDSEIRHAQFQTRPKVPLQPAYQSKITGQSAIESARSGRDWSDMASARTRICQPHATPIARCWQVGICASPFALRSAIPAIDATWVASMAFRHAQSIRAFVSPTYAAAVHLVVDGTALSIELSGLVLQAICLVAQVLVRIPAIVLRAAIVRP